MEILMQMGHVIKNDMSFLEPSKLVQRIRVKCMIRYAIPENLETSGPLMFFFSLQVSLDWLGNATEGCKARQLQHQTMLAIRNNLPQSVRVQGTCTIP